MQCSAAPKAIPALLRGRVSIYHRLVGHLTGFGTSSAPLVICRHRRYRADICTAGVRRGSGLPLSRAVKKIRKPLSSHMLIGVENVGGPLVRPTSESAGNTRYSSTTTFRQRCRLTEFSCHRCRAVITAPIQRPGDERVSEPTRRHGALCGTRPRRAEAGRPAAGHNEAALATAPMVTAL
jgi:hypothetical protein